MNSKPTSSISAVRFLATVTGLYIALSFAQRVVYLVWSSFGHGWPEHLPQAFFKGLCFDLAAATYLFGALTVFVMLVPRRFYSRLWFKAPMMVLAVFPAFLVVVWTVGELFFFNEFHARFNFIAVDYLIYTTEVIRNITESYPMPVLVGALLIPTLALILLLRMLSKRMDGSVAVSPSGRRAFAVCALAGILCAALISEDSFIGGEPYWAREIGKNTVFALFAAYRNNSIDYHEFYSSIDPNQAMDLTRNWIHGDFTKPGALVRNITSNEPEKHWNVVMVVMESLSAGFMGTFGNPVILTPNLDRYAKDGLLFTNLYATGTRTVRGLEALMLSLPPTPGQSILRRPNSDHLFNLGEVFASHGYHTQFIYGGYAYFDNMKDWFSSNGFEVVDRGDFPSSEIHFGNAWGVCDEDLFDQVLKQQEKLVNEGQRFFQVIMTTSNHRPYTYPGGRVDIPSHSGREGAIKYSDYAIGRMIAQAKTKPWFKNTLFIFVADHDASVAGGIDIPVHDYQIPAIIYNPELIKPQKITKLASQIDLGPTLLGLLDFSYQSKFFGQDLRREPGGRALLGTYQKVALLQPPLLTILSPGDSVETEELDSKYNVKSTHMNIVKEASLLSEPARLTVAIYQAASELFTSGRLKTNH